MVADLSNSTLCGSTAFPIPRFPRVSGYSETSSDHSSSCADPTLSIYKVLGFPFPIVS